VHKLLIIMFSSDEFVLYTLPPLQYKLAGRIGLLDWVGNATDIIDLIGGVVEWAIFLEDVITLILCDHNENTVIKCII